MTNSIGGMDTQRQQMAADSLRPLYHFLSPANMLKDPNGAFFWKGEYHLFYQYNPNGAFDATMHWGHAASKDLVHWTDLPIALTPTPRGPDRHGCWSGCAVDNKGIPTIIYDGAHGGTCIATGDDDMLSWEKYPGNPVIAPPPEGKAEWNPFHCLSVWREDKNWYGVLGGAELKTFLFASKDLIHWQYMHPFIIGPKNQEGMSEDCSVPDFFPLGNKHVLLFSSHKRGAQYYIGTYVNHRFHPEHHGRMNFGEFGLTSGHLCAPISLADDQGRRIFFGWIAEGRSLEAQRSSGWSGIMTLPRVLSLADDGTLCIEPAPELSVLRRNHRLLMDIHLTADSSIALEHIEGDCLEMALEFEPGDAKVLGVKVRRAPNSSEQTSISYSREDRYLSLDAEGSSLNPDVEGRGVQRGPFELAARQPLKLHIFLDRSVIEVFANSRLCLTKRIYPSRADSLGVGLFARGGSATVRSMDVWQTAAIWPHVEPC